MSEHFAPTRIQRRRTPGWTMPAGAKYIGRGSRWANPFRIGEPINDAPLDGLRLDGIVLNDTPLVRDGLVEDRAHAVDLHWAWLQLATPYTPRDIRRGLSGAILACWCPEDDQPCHGDTLLVIANDRYVATAWDD